jgi:hypothetical protein
MLTKIGLICEMFDLVLAFQCKCLYNAFQIVTPLGNKIVLVGGDKMRSFITTPSPFRAVKVWI